MSSAVGHIAGKFNIFSLFAALVVSWSPKLVLQSLKRGYNHKYGCLEKDTCMVSNCMRVLRSDLLNSVVKLFSLMKKMMLHLSLPPM